VNTIPRRNTCFCKNKETKENIRYRKKEKKEKKGKERRRGEIRKEQIAFICTSDLGKCTDFKVQQAKGFRSICLKP